MSRFPYERGLHEVADGLYAWLQPDGGWGWSNAGLITSGTASLLVDTLYDLRLTADMLDAIERTAPASWPIEVLVNTHANGDHTYGNQLVGPGPGGRGAEIIASRRCAEEFADVTPETMAGFVSAAPDLGALGAFVERAFGAFDFSGITLAPPTRTFDGQLSVAVGGLEVELIEVGPAHTAGDVIVWVPERRTVFTGDILFHGGHPIVWEGPIGRWIDACARIVDLGPEVVVPGHGPVTDVGAVAALAGYFRWLTGEVDGRLDAGTAPFDIARELFDELPATPYADWGDPERLVINVAARARERSVAVASDVVTLFGRMAELVR